MNPMSQFSLPVNLMNIFLVSVKKILGMATLNLGNSSLKMAIQEFKISFIDILVGQYRLDIK